MHTNKLITLLLVLLVSLGFSLVTMAQETEENTDTSIYTATLLVDGDVIENELTPEVQTILYVFNANEGDVVTLSMDATGDLDPFLMLLGANGTIVAQDDDSGEQELSALISDVEIPETGSYFLIATSYQVLLANNFEEDTELDLGYTLSVSGMTPIEDVEGFNYFADVLAPNEPLNAEISEEYPAWFFIFTGAEGDVVNVTAESDDFDTVVFVFGPSGIRDAVNDDIDYEGGNLNSAIEDFTLPVDGIYLVMVGNPYLFVLGNSGEEEYYGQFTVELSTGK